MLHVTSHKNASCYDTPQLQNSFNLVTNVCLHRVQFYNPKVFWIQMSILFKLILPRDSAKTAVHSSDV